MCGSTPRPSDLDALFGLAVLKALGIGNKKALQAIMKLWEDARKTMDDLADLVHEMVELFRRKASRTEEVAQGHSRKSDCLAARTPEE